MNKTVSPSAWRTVASLWFSLLLIVVSALPGRADAADTKTQDGKSQPAAIKNAPATVTVKVLEVTNARSTNKDRAGIGDKIIVKVDSLKTLIDLSGYNLERIKLAIDGKVIAGLTPKRITDDNSLEYTLVRNAENSAILDSLSAKTWQEIIPVKVSLAVENIDKNEQYDIREGSFKLLIKNSMYRWITFFVFLALVVGTFAQCCKLDARLRVYGADSAYSLSLVQMATWYCIVTASFLYLFFASGCEIPQLNQSTMILLGISSVTAVGAKVINSSNKEKEEKDTAEKSKNVSGRAASAQDEQKTETSKGFFPDILSDEYGISLSRFQIVLWTIIMVCIFVSKVLTEGAIPDFSDSNLLLLMGISSGSYVGYKLKEAPPKEPPSKEPAK